MSNRLTANECGVLNSIKIAATLVGIAAFGIIALRVVEQIAPLLKGSTGYTMESQMVNSQDITGATEIPFTIRMTVTDMPVPDVAGPQQGGGIHRTERHNLLARNTIRFGKLLAGVG